MKTNTLYLLILSAILLLPVQILAEEKYTHIDAPVVSLGIDNQNEVPLKSAKVFSAQTKEVYASTHSYRAFADERVSMKWYYYSNAEPILIKEESVEVLGYQFVYSRLRGANGYLPKGKYKVVFKIGQGSPETTYFKVGSNEKPKAKSDGRIHYDPSKFQGWSQLHRSVAKIKDLSIKKVKWSDKEKQLSLSVSTSEGKYGDDFIFCSKKKNHYYCTIEDDGGYVKIDKDMNIQLDIDFAKETEDGMVSALSLTQKNKNSWVSPIGK